MQGQGVRRAGFLPPPRPVCRRLLPLSSCGLFSVCTRESQTSLPVCPNPSSYKDSSHLGLGPQPRDFSLALITSLKTLCVYSRTVVLGVRTST